jgi:hypothetical protein
MSEFKQQLWSMDMLPKDILIDKIKRLKQILKEIKEIAKILAPMTDEYENCLDRDRCFECDFTEDCSYFNIKQILEKISEVIDD